MKKFFFPIFWKFSLAILLIVLVFGSINAYLTWTNVYTALQEESENKGLFIAQTLAEESINLLLYEDIVELQKLLDHTLTLDSTIYYIFIVDGDNRPVVHTFEGAIPKDLVQLSVEVNVHEKEITLLEIKNKPSSRIRNISVPIFGGKLGILHVGILENRIIRNVSKTVNIFWIMVLLFMIVGFLGALAFTYFITSPIKKIQETASRLDFSALEYKTVGKIVIRQRFLKRFPLLFRAIDEIDLLTDHFNEMIERLEKAYSDLQRANEKLLQSEKLASIGVITSGLAHEINNPIAGINYCIKRSRMKLGNKEEQAKYLDLIEDAIGRIEKVVKELLDFSRRKDLIIEPVNILYVIEKAIILLSYKLEQFQISISNNIDENVPQVIGARDRLTQVFINLILNSIDAIEERMHYGKADNYYGSISFGYTISDPYLVISVKDNGIGIEGENLKKVFDPFFTTKNVGKGTGLGLAVSINMIQAMDGKIEIESKQGEGTEVFIYLKIASQEAEQ